MYGGQPFGLKMPIALGKSPVVATTLVASKNVSWSVLLTIPAMNIYRRLCLMAVRTFKPKGEMFQRKIFFSQAPG